MQQSWTGGGVPACSQRDRWPSGRLYGWARLLPAGIAAAARHISPGKQPNISEKCSTAISGKVVIIHYQICNEYTTCSALYCASTSLSSEMPLCFTASARLIHSCSWPRRISSVFVALKTLSLWRLCRLCLLCSSAFSVLSSVSLCSVLGLSSEAKNIVSGNRSWAGLLTLVRVEGNGIHGIGWRSNIVSTKHQ